jgi:uncharacterized protein (TIGR02594 family)
MWDLLKNVFFLIFNWRGPAQAPRAADGGAPAPVPPHIPQDGDPKWLTLARADLGIREVAGPGANPAIMRAWKYCDYEPPAGDETAWCSAKCNEWLQRAGQPGTRQPNARSWEKYGNRLVKPRPGCIAVLWRGKPDGWEGHVALYVGPGSRPGHIKLLGGNQGDSVSIAEFNESQVLSYRWPVTGSTSTTLKATQAGVMGDAMTLGGVGLSGLAASAPDLLAASDTLQALAPYWPHFVVIGLLLSLVTRGIVVWSRMQAFQTKGT